MDGCRVSPGKLAADNLRRAGNAALRARDPAGAVALLSRAARWSRWSGARGWTSRWPCSPPDGLTTPGPTSAAPASWEPLNPRVPANEAFLWLNEGRHPEAALAAIEETFRRSPVQGARLYGETVSRHGQDPNLRPGLEALARREPALEVVFLDNASPAEVWPWLDEILAADPELTRHAGDPARLRLFCVSGRTTGTPAR